MLRGAGSSRPPPTREFDSSALLGSGGNVVKAPASGAGPFPPRYSRPPLPHHATPRKVSHVMADHETFCPLLGVEPARISQSPIPSCPL